MEIEFLLIKAHYLKYVFCLIIYIPYLNNEILQIKVKTLIKFQKWNNFEKYLI